MAFDLLARLKLQDEMSGRLKKVTRSLGDVEKRTKSVSSGFQNLGKAALSIGAAVGATALLAKGMGMLRDSVGSAMARIDTMERFERTMTILLGSTDAAKASLTTLNDVVTGTAYGLDIAAKSVQAFVSRGVEVNKASKWFEAMGDAVAFYGDGSNEQLESVMDAMGKMTSAGKVSAQQMESLTSAGIMGYDMYAKASGQSVETVKKALSDGKISAEEFFDVVSASMLEGTNGVQNIAGAAKEAGTTWAGALANMRFAVVRGVTSIISSIDEMLADNGLPSIRDMISNFGKTAENALKKVASAISPVVGFLVKLYNAIKPAISYFKAAALAIGGVAVAALAVIGAIKILAGLFAILASPVTLIIVGIAALGVAFKKAYEHSEPFRKFVDGVIGAAKGLFSILTGGSFGESFDIMQSMGLNTEQIRGVYDFANKIKDAVNIIKNVISAIGTGDSTNIMVALGFSPEMIAKVFEFADGIKSAVMGVVEYLKTKFAEMQPTLETLLGVFMMAKDTAIDIFTNLWNFLAPILGAVGGALSILGDIAMMVFQNIIVPAINFVITLFQTMWTVTGPILELLGAAIGAAFEVLKFVWDTILKPVAEWLLGEFKTAFEAATGIVETIGGAFDTFGGKISGALDWFNKIKDAIKNFEPPEWLSKLGGSISAGAAKVGGIFKSNYHGMDRVPYDGYQARLHRGERILTRRESDDYERFQFDGSGGASSYNNQTYNNVNTTKESGGGTSGSGSVTISGNEFHVRKESDIEEVAYELAKLIEREKGRMA